MAEKRSLFAFMLAGILLLSSCANIVSPSGGPADNIPPKVAKEMPPSGSTNFSGRKIEICFNEFVSLQEVEKNISISPPLLIKPQINVAGKCIEVEIDRAEVLQKNTTYTINFGNAISDLNEANALHDFSYSFSTGPFIDSLFIEGWVTHAFNRQKISFFTAGLYDSICDSCIRKAKPLYTARSDENGYFRIKRVKQGRYFPAGFKDDNSNGMADGGELTAFHTQPLYVADSNLKADFLAYKSASYPRNAVIDTINPCKGLFALVFYRPERQPALAAGAFFSRWAKTDDFDTLYIYTKDPGADLLLNYTLDNKSSTIKYPGEARKACPLSLSTDFCPDSFLVHSNNPIHDIVTDSILVKSDTLLLSDLHLSMPDSFSIKIQWGKGFKPGSYQLLMKLGALHDIYGQRSSSEVYPTIIKPAEAFGSIGLQIKNEKKRNLIFQLVDEKDHAVRTHFVHHSMMIRMERLTPGLYRIKVIEDSNSNRKWDEGDAEMLIPPERVFYFSTAFNLRADWDFEDTIIDIELFKW